MERMFGLRRDVELWDAFFGFRLGEERGNRHIDSRRRWRGHCVRYAGIFRGEMSTKDDACCCTSSCNVVDGVPLQRGVSPR